MESKYKNYIIAILIFMNFFTLFRLNSIENTYEFEIRRNSNEINDLRNEINNVYNNVDEKLKKQASIIDGYDITFGELNSESMTIPMKFSVTPKENSAGLKANMLINDEKIPMIKNNASFSANYDANVFDNLKFKVVLEENGVEKIETLEEYSDLFYKFTLNMYGGFHGKTNYSSGNYKYEGNLDLNFVGPDNNAPVKMSIVREINGTVADEKEVDMSSLNKNLSTDKNSPQPEPAMQENPNESIATNFINLPIDETVSISQNDNILIYVLIQDKYGLNYKYVIKADTIDSSGKMVSRNPEWTNGSIIEISDKGGNVLYKPEYIN